MGMLQDTCIDEVCKTGYDNADDDTHQLLNPTTVNFLLM